MNSPSGVSIFVALVVASCLINNVAAVQIMFNLVYHHSDVDVLTAVRYATTNGEAKKRVAFREVPADFDNLFATDNQLCRLLEEQSLVILIAYQYKHIAPLRSYSREFKLPLILLDTGLERIGDLFDLDNPTNPIRGADQATEQSDDSSVLASAGDEMRSPYEVHFGLPYTAAIYGAMDHKKWNSFSVVYDSDDGLKRIHSLVRRFSTGKKVVEVKIKKVSLGSESAAAEEIRLYHKGSSHVLIDIRNSTSLEAFVGALLSNGLIVDQTDFLFAGLNFKNDLTDLLAPLNLTGRNARFAGFHVLDRTNKSGTRAYAQKVAKEYSSNTSRPLSANGAFAVDFVTTLAMALERWDDSPGSFRTLIYLDGKVRDGIPINIEADKKRCLGRAVSLFKLGPELAEWLKSTTLPNEQAVTGQVQFDKQGERVDYSLYYYGQENRIIGPRKLGRYNDTAGFEYFSAGEVLQATRDVNRTRIITTIEVRPFFALKADSSRRTGNDRFEGYLVDVAAAIAERVKFKYEFRLVADNAYGSMDSSGRWNGMIGEVVDGVADMALAPLTITAEREKAVDFSKPFMPLGISIMMRKVPKVQPMFFLHEPLSLEVWCCIGIAYISISLALFFVTRLSPYEWHKHHHHRRRLELRSEHHAPANNGEDRNLLPTVSSGGRDEIECSLQEEYCHDKVATESGDVKRFDYDTYVNSFTFANTFWFVFGTFMRFDVGMYPHSVSGKVISAVWWFFTIIIVFAYTANLAIYLTVEPPMQSVTSAEDLSKQTDIKFGVLRGGSTAKFFQTSKYPVYQQMWAMMNSVEPPGFVDSIEEGVQRVRDGRYAFLLESPINEYINSKLPCNTVKVGVNLDAVGYGIATPKGSDMRDAINRAVLNLREDVIIQGLREKWWFDRAECENTKVKRKEGTKGAMMASTMAEAFYFLIGGLLLGILVLLGELACNRTGSKPNKSDPKNKANVGAPTSRLVHPKGAMQLR